MTTLATTTRREPLSRGRVLREAIAIADEGGIDALTMRRLAQQLGVEPMSIYYHVRGKDAVITGALDLVFEDVGERAARATTPPPPSWQDHLRTRILAAREVLLDHPWVPRALEARGTMTPAFATWVDTNVAVMRSGGLSWDLIHHAMHTLGSRQFGFSQELILDDPQGADGAADPAQAAALGALMPNVQAMLEDVVHEDEVGTLGWCDDRVEFEFALDILLEGLERRARATG
ncbi:TetR family transcriptional regulator [Microbacterium sp. CFH 90308]|uniref:TetR family transcriptional regulator n=1 Tax=Microbacterium salsuginis TaxID=2722803 RepID=A0ABX1KBV9_9MICO|nr:TetR/AcrR family transcriptional regulator C-terminal domain-containing protein [Microbacterium sp. CFH 90308]NLP83992.1 TetR family transcriptional regulator [Microbacterium sp. CFH 90308]